MAFHRLVVPTYFNGLPAGYNYINNALTGTPAPADGARPSGPNAGTYFVGFGEDGRVIAANRGLKALAENTDLLDDLIRRDLGAPTVLSATAGGGGTTSINLTGPLWAGAAGTANSVLGIRTFVHLTDANDNEIYSGASECQVTAITGATPGDEWVGNITLTVSPAIPAATVYKVHYYARKAVATVDKDIFSRARKYNLFSGADNWADGTTNPLTTVTGQLRKTVNELAASTGEAKIGGALVVGSPYALVAGTLREHIIDIVDSLNAENAAMLAAVAALRADLHRVRFLTASATVNTPNKDATLILNPAATFALTLPDPATAVGQQILLINGDGTMAPGNKVTLTPVTGEKINGQATAFDLLAPYGRWILSCDGVDWNLI